MRGFLAKALDRITLRMASSFQASGAADPDQLQKAQKWLQDCNLFLDFERITPDFKVTSDGAFEFASPQKTRWAENNRVFGRLFRAEAGPRWKHRPAVILLHGWNAEFQYRFQFPYLARKLAWEGINTAIIELPYHGRRRPLEPGSIQNFISYDLMHMLEAARQSLADVRALLGWLQAPGGQSVGLGGVSLGAWLAGLLMASGSDSGAAFAVLMTPITRMDLAIQELPFCECIRSNVQTPSLRSE